MNDHVSTWVRSRWLTDRCVHTFTRIDRGYSHDWLILPGWAMTMDYFFASDLPFNYIFSDDFDSHTFGSDLRHFCRVNSIKLTGCFAVSMLARWVWNECHQLPCSTFILQGVRPVFPASELDKAKQRLHYAKDAYLSAFFRQALGGRSDLFKQLIVDANTWSQTRLLAGIDTLSISLLEAVKVEDRHIVFLHGERDRVAPLHELTDFLHQHSLSNVVYVEAQQPHILSPENCRQAVINVVKQLP